MSELSLAQDVVRELSTITATFAAGSVAINDWSLLDKSNSKAPYAIVEASNEVSVSVIQSHWEAKWFIPVVLIIKFDDWDTANDNITTVRQAVIDKLIDVDNYDDLSGRLAWGIRGITTEGGIGSIFDRYTQNPEEALPIFLSTTLVLEVDDANLG